jgi:hypothetical protein
MSRPLLYNFAYYDLPNGVPELLSLLGFFAMWNRSDLCWMVYETPPNSRMRWRAQRFNGGSLAAWQAFLSQITSSEHVR